MKKLEINQKDLKRNLEKIKEISKHQKEEISIPKIIGVVKGNGMGLGLEQYAKFLVENDIKILAVSNFDEAIRLRNSGIKTEILMLTPVSNLEELDLLIKEKVTLTIGSLEDVKLIEQAVKENESISEINVHLKIDTGLGRYGIIFTNIEEILNIFNICEKVKIVGAYTHFSKPIDKKWTSLQFDRFIEVIDKIKRENFNPGILHCCASTAFLKYPQMHLDAVRIGSAIQGRTLVNQNEFKKIGEFKTEIIQIKQLPKGYTVSYNKSYTTKRDTKIAVLPIGYMDGVNKSKLRDDFSLRNNLIAVGMEIKKIFKDNSLKVTIKNKKYPIIGKIGMYHVIVDITNAKDVKVGDIVSLNVSPLQTNEKIRREYI